MKSNVNFYESYSPSERVTTLENAIRVYEATSKIQLEKMALQNTVINEQKAKIVILQKASMENPQLHKDIDDRNEAIDDMKEKIKEGDEINRKLTEENEALKEKVRELEAIIDKQIDVQSHLEKVHELQDQIDSLQKKVNSTEHIHFQNIDTYSSINQNQQEDNMSIGKIIMMHNNTNTNTTNSNKQNSTIEEEYSEAKHQLQNSYLLIMSYRDDIEKLIKQNQEKTNCILELTQENNELNEKIYKSELDQKNNESMIKDLNAKDKTIETLNMKVLAKKKEIEAIQCNHAVQINELNEEIQGFKEREKALLESLYHLKEYTDIVELTRSGSNIVQSENNNPNVNNSITDISNNFLMRKCNTARASYSKDNNTQTLSNNMYDPSHCETVIDNLKKAMTIIDYQQQHHNTVTSQVKSTM